MRIGIEYIRQRLCLPLVVAEIGVWEGVNARYLLDVLPIKQLYLIDPYKHYSFSASLSQKYMDERKEVMLSRFKKHHLWGKVKVLIETSVSAAKKFPDSFFDLVYVDGDHSFSSVKADLEAWYPKVKTGGYLVGHDFPGIGVSRAVEGFCEDKQEQLLVWSQAKQANVAQHESDWLIQKKG